MLVVKILQQKQIKLHINAAINIFHYGTKSISCHVNPVPNSIIIFRIGIIFEY